MSLLTTALILRYLGPGESGLYFSGMAALLLAAAVSEFGLGSSTVRDYANARPDERARLLDELTGLRLLLLTPALAVGGILALVTPPEPRLLVAASLGFGWLLLTVIYAGATVPHRVALRNGVLAGLQVMQAVASLISASVLVIIEAPVQTFFAIQVPGLLIALCVVRFSRGPGAIPSPSLRTGARSHLTRQTTYWGIATILVVAFYRIGPLAVMVLAGEEQAGVYGASFRVFDVIESVAPLIVGVTLPILSDVHVPPSQFVRRVLDVAIVATALGAIAATGTIVLAPSIIGVLAGSGFADSVIVLQILAASLPAAFLGQALGHALVARRAHVPALVANAAALGVTLSLIVVTVSSFGAVGASIALLCGQLVLCGGYWLSLRRHLGVPLGLGPTVYRGFLAATGATAIGLLLPGSDMLQGTLAVALCGIFLVGVRLLTASEFRRLIGAHAAERSHPGASGGTGNRRDSC